MSIGSVLGGHGGPLGQGASGYGASGGVPGHHLAGLGRAGGGGSLCVGTTSARIWPRHCLSRRVVCAECWLGWKSTINYH